MIIYNIIALVGVYFVFCVVTCFCFFVVVSFKEIIIDMGNVLFARVFI